jgi:hypothetical protein
VLAPKQAPGGGEGVVVFQNTNILIGDSDQTVTLTSVSTYLGILV